ncbi:hypothetical protein [Lysobacter sp. CA199]|uniref:hypothetical protein n=1 Tax=Lysobacter sp. CA199 TaxID=3455608 RepID=UPI003F8CFF2A
MRILGLPLMAWLLVAVGLVAAGFGAWAGNRWERGANAITESKALRAERDKDRKTIDELVRTGRALQQQGVDAALAYQQATERMDAIASALEKRLGQQRAEEARQNAARDALLDRRPDLRGLRLGDDVLQHWNRSNEGGADSEPAAARPAAKPASAVPTVPASEKRRGAGPVGEPRRSGGVGQCLPRAQCRADRCERRMAGDGLVVVLRRDRSAGSRRFEVRAT